MSLLQNETYYGIGALATVLIASEIGQRITDAFDEIEYNLNQVDWYLLPIEIKRILPMMIANAQQPVSLECFGSIICSREVFKKVSMYYVNRIFKF